MNSSEPTILLAEDDANDVFFLKRALTRAGVQFSLRVVTNGQEALDYLGGADKFSNRAEFPLASLVLLDLKMPFVNGFDVLQWIRSQPSLKHIPVVVLTSSAEDRDRQRAAELGAQAYFVKPPSREMVMEMIGFLSSAKENSAVSA